MQKGIPQGQPQRQPINSGPKIAVAHVDPCIVYLEATESDEVPVLFACWARSSREISEVGAEPYLKLNHVLVLKGSPVRGRGGWSMQDGETHWHFSVYDQKELLIKSDGARAQKGFPFYNHFESKPARGFQGEIKFIDQETDLSLKKLIVGKSRINHAFVKRILEIAPVEWPSLRNALAFLHRTPKLPHRPKSVFRELLSTLLTDLCITG
jgi:hypothetical protein